MTQRAAHRWLLRIAAVLLTAGLEAGSARAQVIQTFELHPGWNAVFLEVQPEPNDPASVFAGVPIHSVWTWFPRTSTVQFIQNPGEEPWGAPGWSVFTPDPNRAHLTNLFAIQANRAYLVRIAGTKGVTLQVSGRPAPAAYRWTPDSFNLVGFSVDPAAPPTFSEFLGASAAHAGQAVYRLGDSGEWEMIADLGATAVLSGQAYWVYCEGTSTFTGALQVVLPSSSGLDYGAFLTELGVTLANLADTPREVTLSLDSADVVLAIREYDVATGYFTWPPLSTLPPLTLEPGRQLNLRLAVRREQMSAGLAEAVLWIRDDAGSRYRVPVAVEKIAN